MSYTRVISLTRLIDSSFVSLFSVVYYTERVFFLFHLTAYVTHNFPFVLFLYRDTSTSLKVSLRRNYNKGKNGLLKKAR